MTKVIISFDTEDFTSQRAMDGIVNEADLLRDEGIRGCFCLVGYVAKNIVDWNRRDVINALKYHEIDLHTLGHSVHPTIDEATDIDDFDAAYECVTKRETEALELIRKATGRARAYATVPPGNEHSYAAMYAYADMNVPIFSGTFCDPDDGRGAYYCNMFHLDYFFAFENFADRDDDAFMDEVVESLARRKYAVVYTHPHMSLMKEHWDSVNYRGGNAEFGHWKSSPPRTLGETCRFYENMRRLLRRLKDDPRFEFTTYEELAARLEAEEKRVLRVQDMPGIRRQISRELSPLQTPCSLSVSDVFAACRDLLAGEETHVCGKTRGFLHAPYAIDRPVTVSAEALRASAGAMDASGFLPESVDAGGVKLGPADWLRAALDALCGAETVTVRPGPAMPSLDILPRVRDLSLRGTWMHGDGFEDRYLSDRLRLQSWTMRFLND